MTLIDLGGQFLWPRPVYDVGLFNTANGINIFGASTTKVAYVFRAPKTGTLDKIEFLLLGVSAQPMRVSFQDVGASGPDGVVDQYRTFTPATGWNVPGLMTSDGTDTGTKRAVGLGDWIAAVLEWTGPAGDLYIGIFNDITAGNNAYAGARQSNGYLAVYTGGAWTANGYLNAIGLSIGIKYADGTYGRLLGPHVPIQSVATEAVGTTSTPDEIGSLFTLSVPMRAAGIWAHLDVDAATDLVLYDVDGSTVLRSVSVSPTQRLYVNIAPIWVRFTTPVDLLAASGYRLVVKPTTTSTVGLAVHTLNAAAQREAHPSGLSVQYTSRTDAGSWTQTPTKLAQIALIVSGLDAGGGGGATEHAHTFVGVAG